MRTITLLGCLALAPLGLAVAVNTAHAQTLPLVTNGDFESTPSTAASSIPGQPNGAQTDSTTYTGFRFFNVAPEQVAIGSNIGLGNGGGQGFQFFVNNGTNNVSGGSASAAVGGQYGLDIFNNQVPVTLGVTYRVQFDVSTEAGSAPGTNVLQLIVAEFTGGTTFTNEQFSTFYTLNSDNAYHTYSFDFTPTNATATSADLTFAPDSGVVGGGAFLLDNIRFGAVPEPSSWTMMLGGIGILLGVSLYVRQARKA